MRPTQGRTVMIAQVCGGSQSFNVVNTLRKLARWMRMPCVTNQSSVPKAWQEFDQLGRMKVRAACGLPCMHACRRRETATWGCRGWCWLLGRLASAHGGGAGAFSRHCRQRSST